MATVLCVPRIYNAFISMNNTALIQFELLRKIEQKKGGRSSKEEQGRRWRVFSGQISTIGLAFDPQNLPPLISSFKY